MNLKYLFLFFLIGSSLFSCTSRTETKGPENRDLDRLTNLKLRDIDGKDVGLTFPQTDGISVFLFLSPECPLCQGYTNLIRKLSSTYTLPRFRFYGVFPGILYPENEIRNFLTDYQLHLTSIKDSIYTLTRFFGAEVTPEVFVCSETGAVLYSGRIDNLAWDTGQKRLEATEHELEDVLQAIQEGKKITAHKTRAVGCMIEAKQ